MLVPGHGAGATPLEDARYLVNVQMSDLEVRQFLVGQKSILVRHYRKRIGELGGTMVDEAAAALAIPDDMVESSLADLRDRLVKTYVEELSPEQLDELAEFYRSPAGEMVLSIVHAGQSFAQPGEIAMTAPASLSVIPPEIVTAVLTPNERSNFEAFKAGPSWQALESDELGVNMALGFTVFGTYFRAAQSPQEIEVQALLCILEDPDLVAFPNLFMRDEVIKDLRSASGQTVSELSCG